MNDQGDDDTVETLMKKVDKNPIALLNEFCTRAKFKIEYVTNMRRAKSKQTFYCQVVIDGNRLCGGYRGSLGVIKRRRVEARSQNFGCDRRGQSS